MTQPLAQPPAAQKVGRGAAFAALSIVASIALFTVFGLLFGGLIGLAALPIPYLAGWLYTKGAGGPLSSAGRGPFIAITLIAVVLGGLAGMVATFYHGFTAVNGRGGLFGSAFATTVRNQFTQNLDDILLPMVIAVVLGVVGLAAVLRDSTRATATRADGTVPVVGTVAGVAGGQAAAASGTPAAAPATSSRSPTPPHSPAVPSVPTTQSVPAPPSRSVPKQPSPGILLNGKPLPPEKK